jgi:hypothetical protein
MRNAGIQEAIANAELASSLPKYTIVQSAPFSERVDGLMIRQWQITWSVPL